MKKVALVNPPATRLIYGEEYPLKSITPCLGLFYLQAYCKDIAEVVVFEGDFYRDMLDLTEAIIAFRPDILGVTSNTSTYPLCVQLAKDVPATVKAIGGPYSNFRAEECLRNFDVVFLGDAEDSFRQFVEGVPLDQLSAVAYADSTGRVVFTPSRQLPDLDSIPYPDHSKLQLGLYQSSPHRRLPEPMATMVTTRGCGYSCSFCLSAQGGFNDGRYRERSILNVVGELKVLNDTFGVRSVQFWDDTFTMRKTRTLDLCKAISKIGIHYVCNTRADKIDKEICDALAKSGCRGVFLGVESGDPDILESNIFKEITITDITRAIALCRSAGMWSTSSYVFGAIDDTRESIRRSVELAIATDPDYVLFNIYTAHPGTRGYNEAVRLGLIDEYQVNLATLGKEPVGVPTVCRNLTRKELQRLKTEAYIEFYSRKTSSLYDTLVQTYRSELRYLNSTPLT